MPPIVHEVHDNELHFGRGVVTGFIVIPANGEIFFPHGEGVRIFLAGDATRVETVDGRAMWRIGSDQPAQLDRLLRIAALALERARVGDAGEAEMLLEQAVTLDARYVEPLPSNDR